MSLSDLASLGSFVSGVAVLVSLVLLYFQIRQVNAQLQQAERNQQAQIRQGKTDRIVQILLTGTEPSAAKSQIKGNYGAPDISPVEQVQYAAYMSAHFANLEDIFYQHRDGLLTDAAFEAPTRGAKFMMGAPGARRFWEFAKVMYPQEFVAFVDGLAGKPASTEQA
jgi:hypothetical protein